jgi:excisionase family DNA binding protein
VEGVEGQRQPLARREPLSDLYTPEEIAEKLKVSRRTVYGWLKLGKLHGFRAGRGWRIRTEDIEAFVQPYEVWKERLEEVVEQLRSQLPPGITLEEIEADVRAAREAARAETRARGR